MSLDTQKWPMVQRRGYVLAVPPQSEATREFPGEQELAEFASEESALTIATYRWTQPLTGQLGLDAAIGHVVNEWHGTELQSVSKSASTRAVSFVSGPARSIRTAVAAVRLSDGDVAIAIASSPTGDGLAELADAVVASVRADIASDG